MAGGPWGGSEELWAAAARAALAAGHTVHVGVIGWSPSVPAVAALRHAGAEVLERPLKPGRLSLLAGRAAVALTGGRAGWPGWITQLERFRPDVVVISQGSAYECVVKKASRPLLGWLRRSGTPMVNVVQYNRAGINRDQATRRRGEAFYHLAGANLFVCGRNITEAAEWLAGPVPHASVVRNPVNLADTSPVAWPDDHDGGPMRVACVGRLDARIKGQDLLIRAVARVIGGQAGVPGQDVVLSLAGSGPDEVALRELAGRLGVADRVTFLGQVSDIRGLWSRHHLLALASHSEGTPLAMVEAMLLGRPVLVTDVGGCADWVSEGEHGWVAPVAGEAEITSALRRAVAARSRWRELGAAARVRALALFDADAGGTLLKIAAQVAAR